MIKSAVITGTGKGLGLVLCKQFLSEGYRIFALERTPTEALLSLAAANEGLTVFSVDITNYDAVIACRKEVEKKTASVDLIINNAGVWLDKECFEIEDENFDMDIFFTEFNINAIGPLRIIREFLPLLRKGRDKNRAIVNISSDCASYDAVTNWRTSEYAYCMSKAGVNILSNLVANTLADTDIKVYSLFPGWMQTDMGFAGVFNENDTPDVSPAEAARCISELIKKPKLEGYTYCNRFGERMY